MEQTDTARQAAIEEAGRRYWRGNLVVMGVLLGLWALVGLGGGVLLADRLNEVRLGGVPLGFWMAQQGSIVVFVLLILVYAVLLNRLDRKHRAELERINAAYGPAEEVADKVVTRDAGAGI